MISKKLASVMTAFLLSATAATAQSAVYDCTLRTFGFGGWAPDELSFALSADQSEARVIDRFINAVHDGPITVPVSPVRQNQLEMNWSLLLPTRSNSRLSASYRLRFKLSDQTANVRVLIPDDLDTRGGSGSCTKR